MIKVLRTEQSIQGLQMIEIILFNGGDGKSLRVEVASE